MLVVAILFIWVGVVLTLRRVRSAGLPLGWVILFFAPVLNLLFFAVLSVMPAATTPRYRTDARRAPSILARPDNSRRRFRQRCDSPLDHCPGGGRATWLAVTGFGGYGWGLFVGLPFVVALAS